MHENYREYFCFPEDENELRNVIRIWCEENDHFYGLAARIAGVPKSILSRLLFEMPDTADKILTQNGY